MPMLRTVQIITECHMLVRDQDSKHHTVGQLIDAEIQKMVNDGKRIQTIALELDPEDHQGHDEMVAMYKSGSETLRSRSAVKR